MQYTSIFLISHTTTREYNLKLTPSHAWLSYRLLVNPWEHLACVLSGDCSRRPHPNKHPHPHTPHARTVASVESVFSNTVGVVSRALSLAVGAVRAVTPTWQFPSERTNAGGTAGRRSARQKEKLLTNLTGTVPSR